MSSDSEHEPLLDDATTEPKGAGSGDVHPNPGAITNSTQQSVARVERRNTFSEEHGEHPMQNYLSRFVSIICLFCMVTAGIVLSVGNSAVDPMDNPVEFTGTSNITTTAPAGKPHMEPIGPEKLERFLYIAMIAGLVWMTLTLCCPSVLISKTTNNHGCSGQLDTSVLHLLGATLIFAVGAAFLPLINFVGFLSNAECYRDQVWGKNEYEWLLYQICHFLFIFIQPLFLFKFVQYSGQLKFYWGLSHFAIMWLMGTNISLWFHGLVEESNEDGTLEFPFVVIPSSGQTLSQTIRPSNICPASSGLQGVLPEIRPFLHPFALEYSLISAGLFLNLWNRIGKKRRAQQAGRSIEQIDPPSQQTTSLRIPVVGGLIMGLIIVLGLAATIVYQSLQLNDLGIKTDVCNTSHSRTSESALDTTFGVYYGYSIAVSFITLVGCLIVLFYPMIVLCQCQWMVLCCPLIVLCCPLIVLCCPVIILCRKTIHTLIDISEGQQSEHDPDSDAQHENLDRIWIETALLISSVGGIFLINGFGIAAAVGLSNYDGCGVISRWYMADCVLDALHCIAQLLLIIGALHQQWDGTKWRTFVFSCLFIINLGLWGKDLYEVKNIATTALSQVYFGSDVWSVVIHIAFPLCIFFRLHSAASLFPLMMKSCRINNGGVNEA